MQVIDTLMNLALVLAGFTFIIFIHELGHFVAAKWAGIRVLAFAIGFGPAAASYRKGLGFRRGSSEREYDLLRRDDPAKYAAVSPTEYRWNWLPFGGYVKMLGQEDLNPAAVSAERGSYQNTAPWKRMIVISAGVIFNVILAMALFVVVYMAGIKMPAAKVGEIEPGSPAALTVAENAGGLGVTVPGLRNGDTLLEANGHRPLSFLDLLPIVALADKNNTVDVRVAREGISEPLHFKIRPVTSEFSGMLDIGVTAPPLTNRVVSAENAAVAAAIQTALQSTGLPDVRPGMTITSVNGEPLRNTGQLKEAFDSSRGAPVTLAFSDGQGTVTQTLNPRVPLQESWIAVTVGDEVRDSPTEHLVGFTPLMKVAMASERGLEQGLRNGDIFLRIGNVEYPSLREAMAEIKGNAGETLNLTVLRTENGVAAPVTLRPTVSKQGSIGFIAGDSREDSTLVSVPAKNLRLLRSDTGPTPQLGHAIISSPGTRIAAVNGVAVGDFRELRAALRTAAASDAEVTFTLVPPTTAAGDVGKERAVRHRMSAAEREAVNALDMGYENPLAQRSLLEREETLVKAETPGQAIAMGFNETKRTLRSVYVTFLRLFQGSVPVEQLHGPVGIARVGTSIADRGAMYLVLFMAMISVNLAVVNFLPLPIVDGGQFLFLVWEQVRGKPVSIAVQNAATMAGLVLIGSMFLLVTYNDIAAFFKP